MKIWNLDAFENLEAFNHRAWLDEANTNKRLARSLIDVLLMTSEDPNVFEEKKDPSRKKRPGLRHYHTISTLDVVVASSNMIPEIIGQKNLSKTS